MVGGDEGLVSDIPVLATSDPAGLFRARRGWRLVVGTAAAVLAFPVAGWGVECRCGRGALSRVGWVGPDGASRHGSVGRCQLIECVVG